jgi:hypothetical protein
MIARLAEYNHSSLLVNLGFCQAWRGDACLEMERGCLTGRPWPSVTTSLRLHVVADTKGFVKAEFIQGRETLR